MNNVSSETLGENGGNMLDLVVPPVFTGGGYKDIQRINVAKQSSDRFPKLASVK